MQIKTQQDLEILFYEHMYILILLIHKHLSDFNKIPAK